MRGFYLMHRGWLEHPAFGNRTREPFCRAAAWCWMIEEAAHEPEVRRIGGQEIRLERGQFSFSLRYLGKAWGWQHDRVRRFLSELSRCDMIATASATGNATAQNVISICNYGKYQTLPRRNATAETTVDAVAATQTLMKERKKESLSPYGDKAAEGAATEPDPTKQIYDRGLAILGPKRRALLGKLCAEHGEPAVLEAIIACEDDQPVEPAAYMIRCLARAGPKRVNGHRHKSSPVENLALGAMRAAAKFDAIDAEQRDRGTDFPPAPTLLDRRRSSRD